MIIISHDEVPETTEESTGDSEEEAEETEEDEAEEEVEESEEDESEEEVVEETTGKPKVEVYETTVEALPAGEDALETILAEANGAPVILDFQYDDCVPCQDIAPDFEAIKDKYPDAIFRKVDIFEHKDMLADYGVQATPTFKMFVNGELSGSIEGLADFANLDQAVSDMVEEYNTT